MKNHIFKTFAKLHISSLKTRLYINNIKFKLIVLSITTVFFSCNSVDHQINDVRSENIKIYEPYSKNKDLEKLISPYREKLKELEKVLGYSGKSLSIREGELESTLGNLIADILIEESNPVFYDITSKNIDFCLLNFGGVRGSLNKGNITQHDLFTIMPFNNTSTVVKLSGKKVLELLQYFNIENLAHPVSGIKVEFEEEKFNKDLKIHKDNVCLHIWDTNNLISPNFNSPTVEAEKKLFRDCKEKFGCIPAGNIQDPNDRNKSKVDKRHFSMLFNE